jgi:hypothetical protein
MSSHDELIAYIFSQEKTSPLARKFEGWVSQSRRFKVFAEQYKDKIRRKYRLSENDASIEDLGFELETAALLLREEKFTLEYEKYAALKQRGPDFTVTFKTHTPFNVEVRRFRNAELNEGSVDAQIAKLMAVLCDKVGQMPTGIINFLWMSAEQGIAETDLTSATTDLRQRAERKVEEYFTRRGFKSAADFLKQYQQLSGIVLRQEGGSIIWMNSLARHKAPSEIGTAIRKLVDVRL